jgi:type I restriction-modification system DNA methylase subunit
MKSKTETFASLMDSFGYKYDTHSVFEDFLTMSMCTVTFNPKTRLSHYEDLYLETVKKYKDDSLRFQFPKLFIALVNEMEERVGDSKGNDVLGEYYEQNAAKKDLSQFFTPWPICRFIAKISVEESKKSDTPDKPLRILEPSCGSGRFILASAKEAGPDNEFYGIDIDHTCVKMTALNLFLNGVFHSEVMCANALLPDDFRVSYVISFLPFGIFRIDEKEKSRLWHLVRNNLAASKKAEEAKDRKNGKKRRQRSGI